MVSITKKKLIIFIVVCLVYLIFVSIMYKILNPKETEEHKKAREAILTIKENITEELLLNCKIETWKCNFDPGRLKVGELAKYLSEAEPTYRLNHPEPYGSIHFTDSNAEYNFKICIEFCSTWEEQKGVVFYIELYKNGKMITDRIFASTELSAWRKENFPELFEGNVIYKTRERLSTYRKGVIKGRKK